MSQQSAPDRDVASTQPRGRHHALDIGRFGIRQRAEDTQRRRAEDTRRRTLGKLGRQFGDDQSSAPRSGQQGVATRSSMCLGSLADSAERLKTEGARVPSWEALAGGVRPGTRTLKDREPNEPHHGWQKVASTRVNTHHREEVVWPLLSPSEQAQSDPKVVRWRPSHSQHSQWIVSCELIRSRSGCCCCAAPFAIGPSPAISVRVAVLLTSLAITEQHAARWGCLAGEVMPWRVLSPRFVAKAGPGCPPTSW